MSVVIRDDELELFKQNGVTQDQIANTVSTYRNQGLSDDDIRSKVDTKLNEYRSAIPQQQVQQEPVQPITPVNGVINGSVSTTRTPNWDEHGNIYYTDENGNRIKGDPWYKQPQHWLKGATARAINVFQGKGTQEENIDYALNSALIAGSLGVATPAVMAKQGALNVARNQIANLARNPITRNITRKALSPINKFAKSGIGKATKYFTNLGKEGALYGAAHHGINNVYGVENENSLLGDMVNDAGAFMAFGAGAKGLGAGAKFVGNQLSKKGGVIRNSKANLLKFERKHPVATRRINNIISQAKEAVTPTTKYVGNKYYKGIEQLNKLRDKAFSYTEDMLSNDQLAIAKKAGNIKTASEQGAAREELRRINALKNTSNVNIDFDSIERSSYRKALNELTDKGLKESEARTLLAERGMYDPELQELSLSNIKNLNEKIGIKSKEINSKIETLNKVEQAIEEGKQITKENIYNTEQEVLPNGNPINWRDNVRAWREKQQAKSTELQSEAAEHDLNTSKQDLSVNTPKEDLPHVNEPSVSSNDIKPVRQDRVAEITEDDRKTINRLWRRLNYIDAKTAGSATPPYTKYPHRVIEGRMNRYGKDGYKAQVAYDKAVNQVRALDADPRLKNIMLDDIDRAADTYTKNHGVEIKRTQHSEQILQNEADAFMSDLDTRLKPSLNEIISADVQRPPMFLKMLKIKNAMKKGDVEYNSKKAYEGIKNGIYNKKPVITTIRDLSQYDTKIAKDFEGLEDVVIEIRPKEASGLKGVFNPSDNTLWASDIKTLYHEMQHYLQHNFSKLTKEQYNKAARETKIATKHLHKYIDFVDKKLNDFDKRIAEAGKANDIKTKNKLKLEKLNFYSKAIKNCHKWENKYKNSPLEIDAHYAGDNLTLIKNNSIVDMQKGYNYAKEGKLSTTRLLSTERETRILPEISKSTKGRYRQNNRRDIWRRQYSKQGLHVEATGGKEQFRKRTSTLGSRGLNDRGVIETLNHIDDGETAERVIKQFRENTLKRTGLLEAEQAAKAINIQEGNGSVWIQSSVPSKVVKTTDVLGKEAKNQKAGAFGNRKSGEIKYTTREDRIKDDFITAIRADNADALASHGITYSVPLDKKVQGEWVDVNKKALTFGIYTKNSPEWVQTLLAGDEAIEKVFKKEGEDVVNYMKQLSKNIGKPDCKIPKDVFDMLFDGRGENAKTYIDRYWDMSFDHSTNFGNKIRGVGRLVGGLIDGWNASWKRNKLATLSFVINNRLCNQVLLAVQGGKDYLTSLIDAARTKDVDIPNEILSANIGEAFTDFLKKSPAQRVNYTGYGIDKLFNLVSGTNLELVNTKPINKLKYKGGKPNINSKQLPKNSKFTKTFKNPNNNTRTHVNNTMSAILNIDNYINNKWMAKGAQIINKINDKFERFERKQAYSIVKKKYDREKLKNFVGRSELYKTMAADINKCPEVKETILRGIEDMLGNYRTFSKVERNFLKRIKPFYSWDRTIIRTTLALTKKNPARAAWILYETKRLQNIQDDRQEYQQGSIDLPFKDKRNKKQLLINKREYGLPWSSLPRMDKKRWYEGFSSLFTAPYESAIGHKLFLDKEFNDRRYFAVKKRNEKGKKVIQYYDKRTKKMLDTLPVAPRIGYLAKQLLADQVAPWTVNNLVKGDNLLGLIKADKNGNRTEYDTPYDTSFGGFRHNEEVGTATLMSKKGFPYKEKLKRISAQDTAPSTKLLQRAGLSIQTKTPLSNYDKSKIKEEKTRQWRKKHRRK